MVASIDTTLLRPASCVAGAIASVLPQLKRFGASVRRVRMNRKMTQERLAEAVNLNIRTVQKVEAGSVNILLTTVLRIHKALGCGWEELLGEG
jgi:DNA-binding XRE family transcriptional regulator